MVLLGVIMTTALFSVFMSNTATTAMMFAIFTPLFKHFEERDAFKKALVLSIPFSDNIGGMGTIIGTPPNAVAASILEKLGHPVSFINWMFIGVPVAIVLLAILWYILITAFKPMKREFAILFPDKLEMTWDLLTVMITFIVTVLLWMTSPLHRIPAAVVALIPVMIFTMFGIINRDDLKKIEWDVLILVAGGLTLGISMQQTGLSTSLVSLLPINMFAPIVILGILMIATVMISNFMSNTSAANLLIPIVTALAVISPIVGAVAIAFAASLAMSLPISTPPNAIAFATRSIATNEMARIGTSISILGLMGLFTVMMVVGI